MPQTAFHKVHLPLLDSELYVKIFKAYQLSLSVPVGAMCQFWALPTNYADPELLSMCLFTAW